MSHPFRKLIQDLIGKKMRCTPRKLLGHHTSMGWCPGNWRRQHRRMVHMKIWMILTSMFTFQVGAPRKGNSKWTKFLIFRANWWQFETHPKLKWKNKIDDNKGARFNSLPLIQPWNANLAAMKHPAPVNNWQASRVILRSLRPPRWSGVRNFLGKLGRLSPKKTQVTKIWERTSMQREFATRFFGISFVPSLPIPAVFNYIWRGEFITRWKQDAVAVVRTASSNDVMPKWPPLDFSVIDSHVRLVTILVLVIGWPRNTILNFLRSSSVKTLKGTHIAHLLPKLPSSFILITPDEALDNGRVSHYISHPTNAILRSMKC